MPARGPDGLARHYTNSSQRSVGVASPTRSVPDKSTSFFSPFSLVSDTSPITLYYYSNTVLEAPRFYHNSDIPHADHRRPGLDNHQSERTGAIARPAVQCPSGATARSAGASPPKPRAAIGAEDRARETARKPGSPRSRDRAERPKGVESASGEIEVRQAARNGKLDRAADECPDRASTAPEAKRPAGAKRRSEDTNRPERPPSAPRRAHDRDQPEARACPRPGMGERHSRPKGGHRQRCGAGRCCPRWSA